MDDAKEGNRVLLLDRLVSSEEEVVEEEHPRLSSLYLCRHCGAAHRAPLDRCLACGHEGACVPMHAVQQREDRPGRHSTCVCCGANGRLTGGCFREPIRAVRAVNVADVHVLAQDMVHHAERKRLLVFADNRQEAAFQAGWMRAAPSTAHHRPRAPLAEPETPAALVESLRFTFFHWGFHPWAVYIIFALGIAYYHFRIGLPLAPRSLLYPIIGDRYRGMMGHLVDILCTVGTLFGVATSPGIGSMQINTGVSAYTGLPIATNIQIWIIVLITLVATISVVSGIDKGIKLLSQFNILLALGLLLFVLVFGPTLFQIRLLTTTVGDYLQHIVETSLWMGEGKADQWQQSRTIFYWGWWISWSPFVGIFIARISRGRTVQEFVLNVFLAPTAVTFVWLAVFGGSAMQIELYGAGGIAEAVNENVALSLNALLEHLPFSTITPAFATLLVITFFVRSSDSGSLVDDMVTSGGHPDPPTS